MRDVARHYPAIDFVIVHPGVVNTDLGARRGLLGWILELVKREVGVARYLRSTLDAVAPAPPLPARAGRNALVLRIAATMARRSRSRSRSGSGGRDALTGKHEFGIALIAPTDLVVDKRAAARYDDCDVSGGVLSSEPPLRDAAGPSRRHGSFWRRLFALVEEHIGHVLSSSRARLRRFPRARNRLSGSRNLLRRSREEVERGGNR